MLRGHQTLFSNIFPSSIKRDSDRKGSRNVFIEQRDIALATRYYYYIHLRRKRYDDTLSDLEKEFFLTADVIVTRLTPYVDFIKELNQRNINVVSIRRQYPNWNWII
ncbi:hypothetical protein [Pedobacter antarcticus]|uniref:hypothetical protein n=1 Tax=Pedobacter antarcticus TaxID=34086 RepID=UPI0029303617|nr:hypothetical protein [Pedobacter antarcticus]